MSDVIEPRPYVTLRTLAVEIGHYEDEPNDTFIVEVARIDVFKKPGSEPEPGDIQAFRYRPEVDTGPFRGLRLANAVWTPKPPDVLVAALPETVAAIPPELRAGLPCIFVLEAWPHVLRQAPSSLLRHCWDRGVGSDRPDETGTPPVREAWLVSMMLALLVQRAPLEELIARSRG